MSADTFHGEPLVGALGARTFLFSAKGLRSVMYPSSDAWLTSRAVMGCGSSIGCHTPNARFLGNGECDCRYCREHRTIMFPDSCKHGLWSLSTIQLVAAQYASPATHILAAIEPYGPGRHGTQGYRTQFATILALWVNPNTTPTGVRDLLRRQYPEVTMYTTVADLLAEYPDLDDGTGVEGYREALQPKTIHMGALVNIEAIR